MKDQWKEVLNYMGVPQVCLSMVGLPLPYTAHTVLRPSGLPTGLCVLFGSLFQVPAF